MDTSRKAGAQDSEVDDAALFAQALDIGYEGRSIVSGIELRLPRGQSLALVGSNGSGKTTLLRTVAGLLEPIGGCLEVLGRPARAQPGRVAYMGQFHPSSFMLPLRVIDVVRMSRFARHGLVGRLGEEDERAVSEAIDRMGLSDLATQPLNTLSGGQKQRVFIAQAMAQKADLMLLDEPSTNIDARSRETYRAYIREAATNGVSTVIATHDIQEAEACDQTLLLAQRVVAYGKSSEVLGAEALLSTFGIVGRYKEGRIVVMEREHGHEGDCDCEPRS